MQKIDKSTILSKDFETWHNALELDKHPKYNSSSNPNYWDIKMSLLYCQGGLCAYTEQRLCDISWIEKAHWNDKKYNKELTKEDKNCIQGDLEHFDESLKEKNGWSWDNFFVVSAHANRCIKGTKPVKYILKPDLASYEAEKYLIYDFDAGVFAPNPLLKDDDKQDVKDMIDTLGINCIYDQRRTRLIEWKDRLDVGLDVIPNEYITAWNMTKENLESSE